MSQIPKESRWYYRFILWRHLAACRATEMLSLGDVVMAHDLDMFCDPVWFEHLGQWLENHD